MLRVFKLFNKYAFLYVPITKSKILSSALLLDRTYLPIKLNKLNDTPVVDIGCGSANIFYLDKEGYVYGKGDNSRGQLGSEKLELKTLERIEMPEPIVSMSIGLQHNIFIGSKFIRIRESLWMWGFKLFSASTKRNKFNRRIWREKTSEIYNNLKYWI